MKLLFATHNQNKLKEIQALMPANIELVCLKDINFEEDIPETSETISGNAIQKVEYLVNRVKMPVFADDTGLLVDALNGEPGVYSARYAGPERDSEANMQLVLDKLENTRNRNARFVTAIALSLQGCQLLFEGVCEGVITYEKKGEKGFGYDPIFKPNEADKTFAEMSLTEKGEISHRARAFRKLISYLEEDVNGR